MAGPQVYVDLHLILLKEDCLLLGRRIGSKYGADQYLMPAGRLEPDETISDGVIREAKEEAGITIAADDLELVYVLHFRGDTDRLSLFFRVDRWQGEIVNLEPEKCAGWEWHPVEDLPQTMMPYARFAVTDYLSGQSMGAFGW